MLGVFLAWQDFANFVQNFTDTVAHLVHYSKDLEIVLAETARQEIHKTKAGSR